MRRTQSGQAGALMVNILAGQLARRAVQVLRATGPSGSPRASCRKHKPTRPQGVERNIVVTTWDWGDPKQYLHDLIASDRRYPTVNAYGPLFGSARILDRRSCRSSIRKTHTVTTFKAPVRDADTPEGARTRARRRWTSRSGPRPIGARRRSGTPRPTTTTRCSTRRAGSGWRRRCAGRRTRTSARRARIIPRPSCSRWSRRTAR